MSVTTESTDGQQTKVEQADSLNLRQLKLILINAIRTELNVRFGNDQRGVYVAAASLASGDFTLETLKPLIKAANSANCQIDAIMLSHEIPIATALFKKDRSSSLSTASAAKLLHPPCNENLLKLYRFAMTMALDTATAERSFSTVKRLLTDNRRSMTHDRLRNIVVLAQEKALLRDIPLDKFLDQFRLDHHRRLLV